MEMRTCRVCGETKPISEYYKHGKWLSRMCKECDKEESKRYIKKYREEHPGCRKEEHHKYSIKHREELLQKQRARRAKNPQQMRAQSLLNSYILRGKIEKPKVCQVCGKEGRVEAHHSDYSKPLDVIWCCKSCHYVLDKERREKERA